jgi:hypothetical protein
MALGIAILIGFVIFGIVWFGYLGLLYLGFLPGSKPPAWEAGEAVPWQTPGERAAAELEPSESDDLSETGEPDGEDGAAEAGAERRKRKQRE